MKKQKNFKQRGITLVALVITIIILLILAGITISQLTGSGLFENAKLAEEKSKNAQEKEEGILSDYENKIGEYVNNDRETGSGMQVQELWSGSQSSGILSLSDSIYNYNFLVITSSKANGSSAIITVDKTGMSSINGGSPYAYYDGNGVGYWAFNISAISEDGKELTLLRAGRGNSDTAWLSTSDINKILGIK